VPNASSSSHYTQLSRTVCPFHGELGQPYTYSTYLELPVTNGTRTWFVSHVLVSVWKSRHVYNYGELDAVCRIDPPEKQATNNERVLDAFLLFACFGTHLRYREQLSFAQAHGGLHVPVFQKYLEDMLQEWTGESPIVRQCAVLTLFRLKPVGACLAVILYTSGVSS
jgi:hypothetical protein